jgi:hypothetical protein
MVTGMQAILPLALTDAGGQEHLGVSIPQDAEISQWAYARYCN